MTNNNKNRKNICYKTKSKSHCAQILLLCLFALVCVLFSCILSSQFCVGNEKTKSSVIADADYSFIREGTDGSDESPFKIETVDDLKALATATNAEATNASGVKYSSLSYVLKNDLEITDATWTPIGATGGFAGKFDGNYHTITFTNSVQVLEYCTGLFGYVGGIYGNGIAEVKNLGIIWVKGYSAEQGTDHGGVAGCAYECIITNVYVIASSITASGDVSGFIGMLGSYGGNPTIKNCYCVIDKIVGTNFVAGFGTSDSDYSISIEDCFFKCDSLTGTNTTTFAYDNASSVKNSFYQVPSGVAFNRAGGGTAATFYENGAFNATKFKNLGWSSSATWNDSNIWAYDSTVNNGYPSFKKVIIKAEITANVQSSNSMLLLTIVDANNKVVSELGFVTGQNLSAQIIFEEQAVYYILVTRPFGSGLEYTGVTPERESSLTRFILDMSSNTTVNVSFTLTGNGEWKNMVVV